MIDRILTIVGATLILVVVAGPAMAGIAPLPEPGTMTLFGLGVAGAFVARRFINRK